MIGLRICLLVGELLGVKPAADSPVMAGLVTVVARPRPGGRLYTCGHAAVLAAVLVAVQASQATVLAAVRASMVAVHASIAAVHASKTRMLLLA